MRMGSHRCYLPCDQNSRSKGILVFMTCNNTGTAAQSQLSVTHCPQVVGQGSAALRLVALFTPSTLLLMSVLNQHGFKCFTFPLRAMLPSHDTRDLLLVEGDQTRSLTKMFTVSKSGCPVSSLHHFPRSGNQVTKPSTCPTAEEGCVIWVFWANSRQAAEGAPVSSVDWIAGRRAAKQSLRFLFVVWPYPGSLFPRNHLDRWQVFPL